MWWEDNSINNWRNLTISNPKLDLININAHTKFGENRLILLNLLSGNETTDIWWTDNSVKNWRNLPINNPSPLTPNIHVYAKFEEKKIHPKLIKLESGNQALVGERTDGSENTIPYHYHVTGYKSRLDIILGNYGSGVRNFRVNTILQL